MRNYRLADPRGSLDHYMTSRGGRYFASFRYKISDEPFQVLGLPHSQARLAGPRGLEPRTAVLETAVLPIKL